MNKLKTLSDVLPQRQKVFLNGYNRMPHYIYPEMVTKKIKF